MPSYLLDRTCTWRWRVWLTQFHNLGGTWEQDIEIPVVEVSRCSFSILYALSTFMCALLCFPSCLVPWDVDLNGLNRQCPAPDLVDPMRKPRMRLEVRREDQVICYTGPLIRNTEDSPLCQNCFSSPPIKVGGISEHLMVTCLGEIGRSFLKTKVDTLSKEYYICYFQICVGHRWRQPQPEVPWQLYSPRGKKGIKTRTSWGLFPLPHFLLLFLFTPPKTVFSVLS